MQNDDWRLGNHDYLVLYIKTKAQVAWRNLITITVGRDTDKQTNFGTKCMGFKNFLSGKKRMGIIRTCGASPAGASVGNASTLGLVRNG